MVISLVKGRIILVSFLFFYAAYCYAEVSDEKTDFKVFDGTLYSDKPKLDNYGIESLKILYASSFWSKKQSREQIPDSKIIKALSQDVIADKNIILCLDIEDWKLNGDERSASLEKYKATINLFKHYLKDTSIGYYGVLPERDYWASVKDNDKKKIRWKNTNNDLLDFSKNVDVVFPSLYTFYGDKEGWKKYAVEHLKEAKKYGKPVYAFLWPLYHESNFLNKHDYIGDEYWKMQLEIVKKYADGLVLWGGWDFENKRPMKWDENSAWWAVTKKFLEEQKTIK